ncbi:MAG: hypothetical protein WD270_03945 [Acetobacterales bacterium]
MARYASPPARSTSRTNQILILVLVSALVVLSLPTCVLLAFGMLPSWVAYFVDRSHGRYAFRCVAGINITGVAPYALGLWAKDHSLMDAVNMLVDPVSLTVMYGTAGMGWLLYLGMPPVVGTFLNIAAQRRIRELQETQTDLIAEWGEAVASGGYASAAYQADEQPSDDEEMDDDEFEDDDEEDEIVE